MRSLSNRIILLVVAITLVSCASAQLTQDQQARVVVDRALTQLNTWWDAAGTYYVNTPDKKDEWKTVIVPAFDIANRGLKMVAMRLQTGQITPSDVQPIVQQLTNDLMQLLISKGVLK